MSNKKLISILIPCHSLAHLSEAIESISKQTIDKFLLEVVLVCDRIDQAEAEIILKKYEIEFRIFGSVKPGIVSALNLGLSNIDSEYVARMDGDDRMRPNRLAAQVSYLAENKEVLAVGGQLQLIDSDGVPIGFSRYPRTVKNSDYQFLDRSPLAHPAVLFRTSSVKRVGGYRDFLPEDWDLWSRLIEIGELRNLNQVVLDYRVHQEQVSRGDMFALSPAREYVATSYFARKEGIPDSPNPDQNREQWLIETQHNLAQISSEYSKFQLRLKKQALVERQNSEIKLQKNFKALLLFAIAHPGTFVRPILSRFLNHKLNFFNKR